MSGILDFLTGGEDNNAQNALAAAQQAYGNITVPGIGQLTLPQLQQYVNAGLLTPAQAQAAVIGSNAYSGINLSPADVEAQTTALNQLESVAGSGGMTPQMQAALTAAENQVATQEQGANASILDQLAQRGIPTSLMAAALQSANAGQQAQTANLTATQAAGNAQQNALEAMSAVGQLGGQMQSQQWNQAAQAAAAQNAINAQNAANQQQVNLANQQAQQQANTYNTQTAQQIANENTGLSNQRTEYNATVPQTAYEDALQKAAGQAGVSGQQAQTDLALGQQQAQLIGGLIGTAGQIGASSVAPSPTYNIGTTAPGMAKGGYVSYDTGGTVPGRAQVPGDSLKNDQVRALLSPGELVVPRTIAPHPDLVAEFARHAMAKKRPAHPADIKTILDALSMHRMEAV